MPQPRKNPSKQRHRKGHLLLWVSFLGLLPGAASFEERIERISGELLGAAYLRSPLGEGREPDPDPRFRLDRFDCTTYVETVMALALHPHIGPLQGLTLSPQVDPVKHTLDDIRYQDGVPRFWKRRHLMTSQWIPGLIRAGYLTDITEAVGGALVQRAQLLLDQKRWRTRRVARELHLDPEDVPKGLFGLPYLPLNDLAKIGGKIPSGTILSVVRAENPRYPDLVTHQALLFQRPGREAIVRHASPVRKRVVDEPLSRIIRRHQRKKKWPVLGVNLLRPKRPPSR